MRTNAAFDQCFTLVGFHMKSCYLLPTSTLILDVEKVLAVHLVIFERGALDCGDHYYCTGCSKSICHILRTHIS